ncbi:hypothetical protein ACJIZ3_003664 [Penstemon smallii]|uniref:Uncharacterized protein n=1 Tax=Penstemon smallii TaxID=265156 RepID=A0ABD3U9Y0_9LAMI
MYQTVNFDRYFSLIILIHATKKATKDLGYFLAVTTVQSIGEGKVRQQSGDVLFPHGIFLKCGPTDQVYLSHLKMADYQYVPGENP